MPIPAVREIKAPHTRGVGPVFFILWSFLINFFYIFFKKQEKALKKVGKKKKKKTSSYTQAPGVSPCSFFPATFTLKREKKEKS